MGIDVDQNDIEFVHIQYNRNIDGRHDRTHYYFKIARCGLNPVNTEPDKCSEILWIPAYTQLEEFVPFMKEALEALQKGEQYSEFYEAQ